MIASLLGNFTTVAAALAAIAINSLWEGALIVVSVWLLLRVWPRLNAATRYLVWSATMVALVIVPVATTLPYFSSAAPAMTAGSAQPVAPQVRGETPSNRATRPAIGSTHSTIPAAPTNRNGTGSAWLSDLLMNVGCWFTGQRGPQRFQFTIPQPVALAIVGIWLILALVALVRLSLGLRSLERLKHDALPLPVEYRDSMARWTAANKGSREVRLCVSDEIDVPVAVGLFDSMILIPRDLLERLSESEVDQISLHELAHLRRADDWTNGIQRITMALFGWNPAVRFAGSQMDLEREVACDDWVLSLTGSVRPYAVCLTKMAETSSWPRRTIPAPGVFATRKHISLRIERLLGAGRNIATNLSIGPAAAAAIVVGVLAFAMLFVAPSIAAPLTEQATETTAQNVAPAFAAKTAPAVVAAAPSMASSAAPAAAATSASNPQRVRTGTIDVHTPATDVHVPATDVHVPAIDVHVPGTDVHVPGVDVNVPMQSASDLAKKIADSVSKSAESAAEAGARSYGRGRAVADASSVRNCNGCDMAGVNWAGKDMQGVNYTGVDLSRATLTNVNFSGGNFNGVDFSHSNLSGAKFHGSKLTGCDFSHANLSDVDFGGATMSGCQFTGAQLASSEIRSILDSCTGCDFSHADLSGLDLSGINTSGIDFTGANLRGANLSNAKLTGIDFGRANLDGANLNGTELNGCDLSGVNLTHVDLSKATLIGTDLSGRHEHPEPK